MSNGYRELSVISFLSDKMRVGVVTLAGVDEFNAFIEKHFVAKLDVQIMSKTSCSSVIVEYGSIK